MAVSTSSRPRRVTPVLPATETVAEQVEPRPRASVPTLSLLGVIAVAVIGLDQVAKYLITTTMVEGSTVSVLGDVLQLHYVKNPGAAFSLLSGTTWIFAIIASLVVVVIVVFARRIRSRVWALVFGLLLGGTIGNLIDRLFREPGFGVGHVVDFIQVTLFPAIFNVADISIVTAMGIFIVMSLRGIGFDGTRAVRTPAKSQPTSE
jgi:signal peptidase II